ncbi:MAG TPA: WhiB family transcriptional regulator [Acidimicrobiales bacterium]|nr:WhiB family transcriptional regulator [Acidimicrobiales bacterium]
MTIAASNTRRDETEASEVGTEALALWLMTPHAGDQPPIADLFRRPDWQSEAACRGEPVSTFIADRRVPTSKAVQLCASCGVREQCLEFALTDPALVGYWAGTSARDRRRLRAARGQRPYGSSPTRLRMRGRRRPTNPVVVSSSSSADYSVTTSPSTSS